MASPSSPPPSSPPQGHASAGDEANKTTTATAAAATGDLPASPPTSCLSASASPSADKDKDKNNDKNGGNGGNGSSTTTNNLVVAFLRVPAGIDDRSVQATVRTSLTEVLQSGVAPAANNDDDDDDTDPDNVTGSAVRLPKHRIAYISFLHLPSRAQTPSPSPAPAPSRTSMPPHVQVQAHVHPKPDRFAAHLAEQDLCGAGVGLDDEEDTGFLAFPPLYEVANPFATPAEDLARQQRHRWEYHAQLRRDRALDQRMYYDDEAERAEAVRAAVAAAEVECGSDATDRDAVTGLMTVYWYEPVTEGKAKTLEVWGGSDGVRQLYEGKRLEGPITEALRATVYPLRKRGRFPLVGFRDAEIQGGIPLAVSLIQAGLVQKLPQPQGHFDLIIREMRRLGERVAAGRETVVELVRLELLMVVKRTVLQASGTVIRVEHDKNVYAPPQRPTMSVRGGVKRKRSDEEDEGAIMVPRFKMHKTYGGAKTVVYRK